MTQNGKPGPSSESRNRRGPKSRFTDEAQAAAVQAVIEGRETYRSVARKLGVSSATVHLWANKFDMTHQTRQLDVSDVNRLLRSTRR